MALNRWISGLLFGLVFANAITHATPSSVHEQIQIPQCLAAKISSSYEVLAENQEFKIIDVLSGDVDSLTLLADQVRCGRFVNVSHKISGSALANKKQSAQKILQKKTGTVSNTLLKLSEAYEVKHKERVNTALKQVDSDNIWQTVTHLTSFQNRSATQDSGVDAANWLKASFESMATEYGRKDTSTFFVKTGWYKQPSLITVIGKELKGPAVVIGAHMDTLDGRMPGAGDDASGSASIMEMARVLMASNTTLKRPVYIIWYAAEERGLVGSQYVVEYFKEQRIDVKAVIQFDMAGYRVDPSDPTMWVYTDFVDNKLTNFVAKLIDIYVRVPVKYSQCGYGCSDHASWTDSGIPAAFPCETSFPEHNPYIHTSSDTMDLLNLDHMTNFSKLALAFAIELASD